MGFKKIYILLTSTLLLFVLAGCSSSSGASNSKAAKLEPDTFSEQDMAIYKVDNSKERVSYGMRRKDAEKVLGTGSVGITNSYTYESGVSVLYRDDKAVAITLKRESQGTYRTARGAETGMTKANIKELYGEKYAFESSEKYMEYYYDTEVKQLVEGSTIKLNSLSGEALKAKQLVSTAYDAEGNAILIILLDGQAANTFK
ncbi:hypothetical protein [Paenibacillus sp. 22594]|uniref:hypothetical protein n=1 Tax=Paenibacillus sp. 22594 TaxID=3453947 RepID=UPI003F85E7AD